MLTQISEFTSNNPLLVFGFIALLVAIVVNEIRQYRQSFTSLSPMAAVQLMNNEEAVLLDVREPSEISGGRIGKAIQIPVGSIKQRITEMDKYKTKPILVYCKSGARSSLACSVLNKAGFESVYSLKGGMIAWQEALLPVSKK